MAADDAKPRSPRKAKKDAPPPYERKARGFLRAAELTPGALKSAGAKRGFAELRLLTEWRAVVGEALARVCRPVKVSYRGRSGPGLGATLVVTAEGARAPEVEMRKTQIIDRVNAFYGYRAVSRLTIDQSRTGAAGFAEAETEWRGPDVKARPVDGVVDAGLALALGRLGANVAAKARVAEDAKRTPNDKPAMAGPDKTRRD